jgi:hypothetical protein
MLSRSRGFGDTVAKVTAATGVKRLVKKVTKVVGIEDCGCSARQEVLNDPKLLVNKVFYKTTNN